MAVERRGFSSAIWNTSYNQFFGPPSESYRFIEPFTPAVNAFSKGSGPDFGINQGKKKTRIPLVKCAVSHGARCILSTANAIDMDSAFITKYIAVEPLYELPDGTFDPFWVKLIKFEHGFEEEVGEILAMMRYLCTKFVGPDCYLYPTNNPRRIYEIDSKLSFDLTYLQPSVLEFVGGVVKAGKKSDPAKASQVLKNMAEIESILSRQRYVADNNISLADVSIITTVTMLEIVQFDFSSFPALHKWMLLVKSLPFYRVTNFNFEEYTKEAIQQLSK